MHLHLSCWPAGLISTFHSSSVSPLATGNVKNLKSVWTAASTDDSDIFILFFVPPVFLLRVALMFWTTYNQFETGNQRTCLHWNNLHINLPSAEPECWSLWTCSGTDPLGTVPGEGNQSSNESLTMFSQAIVWRVSILFLQKLPALCDHCRVVFALHLSYITYSKHKAVGAAGEYKWHHFPCTGGRIFPFFFTLLCNFLRVWKYKSFHEECESVLSLYQV